MIEELPEILHAEVNQLSERGNALADEGKCEEAVACFEKALDLLPQPIERWSAACWLFTAIGDTYFSKSDYSRAIQPLLDAVKCHGGVGNPFLHLRLGQTQFELGNDILAADELARAYMTAGTEIFEGEDAKYFALVKSALREPPEGW